MKAFFRSNWVYVMICTVLLIGLGFVCYYAAILPIQQGMNDTALAQAPATAASALSLPSATSSLPLASPTAFQPSIVESPTSQIVLPAIESTVTVVSTDSGFQFLERPVTVTVVVDGEIDWNEQLAIDGWIEIDCLAPNVRCYYNQSAVGKTQTITGIEVKQGSEVVFGGYAVDVEVKNIATGETIKLSRTKGVYGTIPAGMLIVKMVTTDGFTVISKASDAQNEFCARVAQTYAENWALSTTFPNPDWSEPICSGTYKVPVDSDRLNGGSLPFVPTATP